MPAKTTTVVPGIKAFRGIQDADEPDGKRSRYDTVQSTRSKVARLGLEENAATASHSEIFHATIALPLDGTTALDADGPPNEEAEDEAPEEAVMDDRKPDISLIDLPHSAVVPAEHLWRQCAVFMEMKKNAQDGPLGSDTLNARLPEGAPVMTPRLRACKKIIIEMADNARILMATRPFLRFCLHIAFCGTNFNLALFDRNGVVISRTYHFETHFGLFIRIIRRLSCEMTAYDLGLDTTVRPEGCLGSVQYPAYLVKISDTAWYRTDGVPLWQSTSLLGRGTLVFRAREYSKSSGPFWILKNAWREDGRLKESELYELMQKPGGPFQAPPSLAKWVAGGDVLLHNGQAVTIKGHRAQFGSTVIDNGATIHRLILASRGKSLGSYTKLKQLLKAAWVIVIAHKALHDQGILHGDLSYGNTFLFESPQDRIYGFLADLDLASVSDAALNKLPKETADILKEQRRKGPRSGTVIFMALELLRSQDQHHTDEIGARRKGKQGPPTLSTERQAYHDLEAFLWVLVYAMMVHHYNTLTHESDRQEYRAILESYFGHGSATIILDKRIAMIYSAQARVGEHRVSRWFPDPHERTFFIRCMALIAEHDREEEEKEDFGSFQGDLSTENLPWDSSDDDSDNSPDEDAEDQSGTYRQGKATKRVQEPSTGLRKRPPVITYESVAAILEKSLSEL